MLDSFVKVGTDHARMEILERSLTRAAIVDKHGNDGNIILVATATPRSRAGVSVRSVIATPLLRRHVAAGVIGFGINHEMRDFVHDRKKDLDLVRRPQMANFNLVISVLGGSLFD